MPRATKVFEQQAETYKGPREKLILQLSRFYGTAVEAISLAVDAEKPRILDLGAGTGILASAVLDGFPDAELTLFDISPRMLEQARDSLAVGASIEVGDMYEGIPQGPWDAVASALAIHHMTDEGKEGLYQRVFDELKPGGIFVNAEHVNGETAELQDYYAAWHRDQAFEKGLTEAEWSDTVERMSHDHLTPLSTQLQWLSRIGFTDVDCMFRDHGFAVFFGRRPLQG